MNLNFTSIKKIKIQKSLPLDCGTILDGFDIAYQTFWRALMKINYAILVFHALSGDQFATEINTVYRQKMAGGVWL